MLKKRIYITGVGGQGSLMATALIGQAAVIAGINVNLSEIHGMAQRGGIVESSVMLGDIWSPTVSEAEADVLLGFEPLETIRAIRMCSRETTVITNSTPLKPFTVSIGKEQYPDVFSELNKIEQRVKTLVRIDASSAARLAGNILSLNIVMLGAMAKYADLPLTADNIKNAISKYTKPSFLNINTKAFDLGYLL